VYRCWSFVTANRGFLKKTLGHLSFMITGYGGLSRAARDGKPDAVILSIPTFFSVITAWLWCSLYRVPWVFEFRDLWPAILLDLPDVRFEFVGEGAEKDELIAEACRRNLTNVLFRAGVPKRDVIRWYRLAEVGLVPLRKIALFRTFIPSKMFELMASGVPIVA